MTEPLLTLQQAAELLRCSTQTLRRRIARGELPAFRDRRLLRLRPADVAAYVAKHTVQPQLGRPRLTGGRSPAVTPPPRARLDELPDPLP